MVSEISNLSLSKKNSYLSVAIAFCAITTICLIVYQILNLDPYSLFASVGFGGVTLFFMTFVLRNTKKAKPSDPKEELSTDHNTAPTSAQETAIILDDSSSIQSSQDIKPQNITLESRDRSISDFDSSASSESPSAAIPSPLLSSDLTSSSVPSPSSLSVAPPASPEVTIPPLSTTNFTVMMPSDTGGVVPIFVPLSLKSRMNVLFPDYTFTPASSPSSADPSSPENTVFFASLLES